MVGIIKEKYESKLGQIGVARFNNSAQITGDAIRQGADKFSDILFDRAAQIAQRTGEELAANAPESEIYGLDENGQRSPLRALKGFSLAMGGTIQRDAYRRLATNRFRNSVENDMKQASARISIEVMDKADPVAEFDARFGDYIAAVGNQVDDEFKSFTTDTGSLFLSQRRLVLLEQQKQKQIREAKAAQKEAYEQNLLDARGLGYSGAETELPPVIASDQTETDVTVSLATGDTQTQVNETHKKSLNKITVAPVDSLLAAYPETSKKHKAIRVSFAQGQIERHVASFAGNNADIRSHNFRIILNSVRPDGSLDQTLLNTVLSEGESQNDIEFVTRILGSFKKLTLSDLNQFQVAINDEVKLASSSAAFAEKDRREKESNVIEGQQGTAAGHAIAIESFLSEGGFTPQQITNSESSIELLSNMISRSDRIKYYATKNNPSVSVQASTAYSSNVNAALRDFLTKTISTQLSSGEKITDESFNSLVTALNSDPATMRTKLQNAGIIDFSNLDSDQSKIIDKAFKVLNPTDSSSPLAKFIKSVNEAQKSQRETLEKAQDAWGTNFLKDLEDNLSALSDQIVVRTNAYGTPPQTEFALGVTAAMREAQQNSNLNDPEFAVKFNQIIQDAQDNHLLYRTINFNTTTQDSLKHLLSLATDPSTIPSGLQSKLGLNDTGMKNVQDIFQRVGSKKSLALVNNLLTAKTKGQTAINAGVERLSVESTQTFNKVIMSAFKFDLMGTQSIPELDALQDQWSDSMSSTFKGNIVTGIDGMSTVVGEDPNKKAEWTAIQSVVKKMKPEEIAKVESNFLKDVARRRVEIVLTAIGVSSNYSQDSIELLNSVQAYMANPSNILGQDLSKVAGLKQQIDLAINQRTFNSTDDYNKFVLDMANSFTRMGQLFEQKRKANAQAVKVTSVLDPKVAYVGTNKQAAAIAHEQFFTKNPRPDDFFLNIENYLNDDESPFHEAAKAYFTNRGEWVDPAIFQSLRTMFQSDDSMTDETLRKNLKLADNYLFSLNERGAAVLSPAIQRDQPQEISAHQIGVFMELRSMAQTGAKIDEMLAFAKLHRSDSTATAEERRNKREEFYGDKNPVRYLTDLLGENYTDATPEAQDALEAYFDAFMTLKTDSKSADVQLESIAETSIKEDNAVVAHALNARGKNRHPITLSDFGGDVEATAVVRLLMSKVYEHGTFTQAELQNPSSANFILPLHDQSTVPEEQSLAQYFVNTAGTAFNILSMGSAKRSELVRDAFIDGGPTGDINDAMAITSSSTSFSERQAIEGDQNRRAFYVVMTGSPHSKDVTATLYVSTGDGTSLQAVKTSDNIPISVSSSDAKDSRYINGFVQNRQTIIDDAQEAERQAEIAQEEENELALKEMARNDHAIMASTINTELKIVQKTADEYATMLDFARTTNSNDFINDIKAFEAKLPTNLIPLYRENAAYQIEERDNARINVGVDSVVDIVMGRLDADLPTTSVDADYIMSVINNSSPSLTPAVKDKIVNKSLKELNPQIKLINQQADRMSVAKEVIKLATELNESSDLSKHYGVNVETLMAAYKKATGKTIDKSVALLALAKEKFQFEKPNPAQDNLESWLARSAQLGEFISGTVDGEPTEIPEADSIRRLAIYVDKRSEFLNGKLHSDDVKQVFDLYKEENPDTKLRYTDVFKVLQDYQFEKRIPMAAPEVEGFEKFKINWMNLGATKGDLTTFYKGPDGFYTVESNINNEPELTKVDAVYQKGIARQYDDLKNTTSRVKPEDKFNFKGQPNEFTMKVVGGYNKVSDFREGREGEYYYNDPSKKNFGKLVKDKRTLSMIKRFRNR
tara:strand:- start:7887 stop:13322 length:5436 start_codon:yes stop_codon:yes gene_type:complete